MTAAELAHAIQPVLENWYNNLKKHLQNGILSSSNTIYCRDVVNLYETEEYFAIELAGQQKLSAFQAITFNKKIKKLSSINSLINGGSIIPKGAVYNPRINIATAGEVWIDLHVASYDAYNSDAKCMSLSNWKEGLAGTPSIPVQMQDKAGGLFFAESTILRLEAPQLFVQELPMLLVVSKHSDPIRLVHFLIARLNETFPKRDRFVGIFDDEYHQKNPIQQLIENKDMAVEDFLEKQGTTLAKVLGYQGAKANIQIDNQPPIDLLLEKEDGTYDLLNLQLGLFSRKNTKGKKNKPNLSAYTQTLKEQWQTCQAQQTALEEQIGLQLAPQPLLIGVVENSNQVYSQTINKAAREQAGQVALVSLEGLSTLVKLWMQEQG